MPGWRGRRRGRLSRHRLRWHGLRWRLRVPRIGGLRAGIRRTRIGGWRVTRGWLLRIPRLLGLRVALGRLWGEARRLRLGVALRLGLGIALLRRLRRLRWIPRLRLRIARLLRVAARSPRGRGRRWLPGGWCDGALLTGWDIRRRGPLQRGLAALQQVGQATLVDIEVARQVGIRSRPEQALAALEFPEQIEGLPRAPDPAAAGVDQGAGLEGIHPVPTRFAQLEHTRLGTIDHLVEDAKHAGAIDGAERGRSGLLGALLHLALGEELHTAVTGGGRRSLPV